jgi:hypothetical protein
VTKRPAMRPLPIFCGDACSSLFGTMLWPDDISRAERYAAYHLTRGRDGRRPGSPFLAYGVAGHDEFTEDLASALARGDMSDRDVEARFLRDLRAGAVVKTLWALICSQPAVASWTKAIQVVQEVATAAGHRTGRSSFRADLSLLRPVLHWWGAFALRGRAFHADPAVGYELADDLAVFVAEAGALRQELCRWCDGRHLPDTLLAGEWFGKTDPRRPVKLLRPLGKDYDFAKSLAVLAAMAPVVATVTNAQFDLSKFPKKPMVSLTIREN